MSARARLATALLIACAAVSRPASAQSDWVVGRVQVRVEFEPDGRLVAAESLDLTVRGAPLESFVRRIPTRVPHSRAFQREYPFELIGVTDAEGHRQLVRPMDAPDGQLLEISAPGEPIAQARSFRIVYRVWNALTPGAGQDDLRWPAVGPWPVPVEEATVVLRTPAGSLVGGECRLGRPGGDVEICVARFGLDEVTFLPGRVIAPGEVLTVGATLRPGSVPSSPPRLVARIRPVREYFDLEPGAVAVMLGGIAAVAGVVGLLAARWRSAGVPAGDGLTAASLRPAVFRYVLGPRSTPFDPAPTIVDLASRGYLSLADVPGSERDWRLEQRRPPDASLTPHERVLLDGLFGARDSVKVSDLGGQFAATCREAARVVHREVVEAGWSSRHESRIRLGARIASLVLAVAGAVSIVMLGRRLGLGLAGVPVVASAAAFAWFGRAWPALTPEGHGRAREAAALAARLRSTGTISEETMTSLLAHALAAGSARAWLEACPSTDCRRAMPWFMERTTADVSSFAIGLAAFSDAIGRAR